MKTVESGDVKARPDMLLAEIAEAGESMTITERGRRPVAMLTAVPPCPPRVGELPDLAVPEYSDDPLPELERPVQEGDSPT